MELIDNRGITDPRVNLALEEHILRTRDGEESLLLFYINDPSIIIGRHQNTIEEINTDVVRDRGIHVVRRISGGGAVYHDEGNLNFSFLTQYQPGRFNKYEEFTRPVVDVLQAMGVPAEVGGRNDITADGRKISGNAQFVSRGRMFSHGTVLVNSDLDAVTAALNVKPGKIESKGHKSVRSRVANISEFLPEPLDPHTLRARIIDRIFEGGEPVMHEVTDEDWAAVEELSATKYRTWEWNYGEGPKFNTQRTKRFPVGEIDLRIQVDRGQITSIRIFGDFMSRNDPSEIEALLQGSRYERATLSQRLSQIDLDNFFGGIERDDFLELLVD